MKININLLPKDKVKENENNLVFRFVTIQLFLIIFIVFFVTVAFFSLNQVLKMRIGSLEEIGQDLVEQANFKEINSYEDKFKEVNDSVDLISEIQASHFNWFNVLDELISKVPDGVRLTSLSNKDFVLLISGVAETRDDLLHFESNLKDNECLIDINLPFSYLVAKDNVDFQLDAQIKIDCLKK